MRIVFAASEVYPYVKTGGLADVVAALARALVRSGQEVLVVAPWYRTLRADPPPLWIGDVGVPYDGGIDPAGVGTLEADGVRFAFVGHPDFGRDAPYGYDDDVARFARFARAVPAVAERVDVTPDVVHAHDWQAAMLLPVLAHGFHLPPGWPGAPSVLTIHNVQHQGVGDLDDLIHRLRLPRSVRASGLQWFGRANALQGGIDAATRVTTVSPTYAAEITTPAYGFGLDGTLAHERAKLRGIVNGIDTDVWNPASDPHLAAPYDADDPSGKAANAAAVRRALGLDDGGPLLATVSRFAEQKGIDLLLEAVPALRAQGWRLALLGAGDGDLEAAAQAQAAADPRGVAVRIGVDEGLAHRLYAGADAFAIPSRFEPCGLTQMIAMRYGTLPIARATGGLRDTIRDGETGVLFDAADAGALVAAAGTLRARLADGSADAMRRAAMRERFDWDASAAAYEDVYREARAAAGKEPA